MRVLFVSIGFVLGCSLASAQTFEEYKRQMATEYQEYKDARDKEFVSFLKQQWTEFQEFKGVPQNKAPKPQKLPVALPPPEERIAETPPKKVSETPPPAPLNLPSSKAKATPPAVVKSTPAPEPAAPLAKEPPPVKVAEKPIPLAPVVAPVIAPPLVAPPAVAKLPEPVMPAPKLPPAPLAEPGKKNVTLDYFGMTLTLSYAPEMNTPLNSLNQNALSDYWGTLSKTDYEGLLAQLTAYQKSLKLNDWGTYVLVDKLARHIEQGKENETVLLSWFLLSKLGFDTKIGYNEQKVYLMAVIGHPVYQVAYFVDGAKKYYVLSNTGRIASAGSLYTYKGNYPNANTALTFQIKMIPLLAGDLKTRTLNFQYGGQRYNINAQYAPRLMDYYKNFPQSDYPIYFAANSTDTPMSGLLSQLAPLLKGKSEEDAVNLLLRFVQTSFPYQTDDQQFHYEKVMLPEETLFYPYSDCEDRTILFGYLVKNLLGLPVVALHFSDHLAAAVAFSTPVQGDAYTFKGKRFVVSDPTYINANAGMTMPQYKNSQPELIEM